MKWARKQTGFTIVELLIVVVVIAILAAITIVAYNGITNRSKSASVQADVANAVKKLEAVRVQDSAEQYPASLAAAGVSASAGNTYYYQIDSNDNSYCVQSSNGESRWYASSEQKTPSVGLCGADSLVAQWALNGNLVDATANGLNGTGANVTVADGQSGQASGSYSFPGSSSYVTFGNSTQFNQTELTMSAWIRPAIVPTGSMTIMAKEGKYKYRLAGATVFGILTASASGWSHTPTCNYGAGFAANTWYHIATTISSTSGRIKGYVNGVQLCDQPGPVITSFTTTDLMIGSYNTAGGEGFNGRIDDARFYKRALKGAELKSIYDSGAQ